MTAGTNLQAVRSDLQRLAEEFEKEVGSCHSEFTSRHTKGDDWEKWGCAFTLYGYVMWCFAYVDLLSSYCKGFDKDPSGKLGQSQRMIRFMMEYGQWGPQESEAAINLWRHVLMHTAKPRYLFGNRGKHTWHLTWGSQPTGSQSPNVAFEDAERLQLRMTIFGLIADVKGATGRFLEKVGKDTQLQSNVLKFQALLDSHGYTDRLSKLPP